jgi:hypothetical protein
LFARGVPVVVPWNDYSPAVWVKKDLGWIKAQAIRRIKWSLDSICVDLPRAYTWYKYMPVVIGAIGGGIDGDGTGRLRIVLLVEKQQFNPRGLRGEDAEVHTLRRDRCAERSGSPNCSSFTTEM